MCGVGGGGTAELEKNPEMVPLIECFSYSIETVCSDWLATGVGRMSHGKTTCLKEASTN